MSEKRRDKAAAKGTSAPRANRPPEVVEEHSELNPRGAEILCVAAAHALRERADPSLAAVALRRHLELTEDLRELIADYLDGKVKRRAGHQRKSSLERFKDLYVRAPMARATLDQIVEARRAGGDLSYLPWGGPEKGESSRHYVARLMKMSETALENLLKATDKPPPRK